MRNMKRNMRHQLIGTIVVTATLLTSCDMNDPIYNTSHPNHGVVTLTTDWSQIGEGLEVPSSYTLRLGDYTTTLSGTTNTIDHRFDPGTYQMLVYNTPENIRMDNTVAEWDISNNDAPGWLFSYAAEVTITEDTDHAFTAVMQQQVRQLTLVVEPTGDAVDRIERIRGGFIGVASKLDIEKGIYSEECWTLSDFSKITEGADAGKWTMTMRLLGFIPEGNKDLELYINFKNNNPKQVAITSDLAEALATFNTDKRTPLVLRGTMVETPTESGFSATIDDWTPGNGNGEDIDANM